MVCRCSTPVLATLLAYVSSTRDPLEGGALLLAYTCGYVAPLLLAASFTVGCLLAGATVQSLSLVCAIVHQLACVLLSI